MILYIVGILTILCFVAIVVYGDYATYYELQKKLKDRKDPPSSEAPGP